MHLEAAPGEHRDDGQAAHGSAICGCRLKRYEVGRVMLCLSPLIALPLVVMGKSPPSQLRLTADYVYVARGMDYGVGGILAALFCFHMLAFHRSSSVDDRQVCHPYPHMICTSMCASTCADTLMRCVFAL